MRACVRAARGLMSTSLLAIKSKFCMLTIYLVIDSTSAAGSSCWWYVASSISVVSWRVNDARSLLLDVSKFELVVFGVSNAGVRSKLFLFSARVTIRCAIFAVHRNFGRKSHLIKNYLSCLFAITMSPGFYIGSASGMLGVLSAPAWTSCFNSVTAQWSSQHQLLGALWRHQ